jgi:hypothetical protein
MAGDLYRIGEKFIPPRNTSVAGRVWRNVSPLHVYGIHNKDAYLMQLEVVVTFSYLHYLSGYYFLLG